MASSNEPTAPTSTLPGRTLSAGAPHNAVSMVRIVRGEELGAGTSGTAFQVQNPVDGQLYVCKRIPVDGPQHYAQVCNEARLHSRLDHPAIVKYCYCWEERPGDPGAGAQHTVNILMERCTTDLWTCLQADPPDAAERARWSVALLEAVAALQQQGIIHRDLNPFNAFVCARDGRQLKLGDLGMAVLCPPSVTLSGWESEGAVPLDSSAVGSLYSAPELGSAAYDNRVDVFSAGMTLFCLWHFEAAGSADALVDCIQGVRRTGDVPRGFLDRFTFGGVLQRMVSHEKTARPRPEQCLAVFVTRDPDRSLSDVEQPTTSKCCVIQ